AMPAAAAAAQSAARPVASEEFPKLAVASLESGANGITTFFTAQQLDALKKLGDAIVPHVGERPSATQASVPGFLGFLIGQAPKVTQDLYREGLDRLVREGVNDQTLAPLRDAWTYAGPSDRFAQFLQRAKADIVQATTSSREWAESLGRGRRGSSPSGYYWR